MINVRFGTKRTCPSRWSMSAYWGKADSQRTFPECLLMTQLGHRPFSPTANGLYNVPLPPD